MKRWFAGIAAAAALGLGPGVAVPCAPPAGRTLARGPDTTTDALVTQLRSALVDRRDGGQDRLMAALRQLRDPALRPLFAQLASGDRPLLRVHGILGLAELDTPARVDLLLVKRIEDPRDQLVILGEALRSGLLEPAQLQDVVRWPGLDETLVVLILGKLRRLPGAPPVDLADLRRLLYGPNQAAGVFAALELVQAGESIGAPGAGVEGEQGAAHAPPPPTPLDRVLALDPGAKDDAAAMLRVLAYIRDEHLTRLLPFALRLSERMSVDPGARLEAAAALVSLAPGNADVLSAWGVAYRATDLPGRIRLGLEALEAARLSEGRCPAELFDLPSADESALLKAIGAAGAAVVSGRGQAESALALIQQRHRQTMDWALRLAGMLSAAEARTLRLGAVQAAAGVLKTQADLFEPAARAAAALAAESAGDWRNAVSMAVEENDEPLAIALLAGALRSGAPVSAEGLIPAESAGDCPTAATLADLLRFRGLPEPAPADFDRLAAIALGAGGLPEAYRVQAAWLALKCRGEQRVALARVLAEGP